jgi:predicted GIY-YIG superfamily endonuclease
MEESTAWVYLLRCADGSFYCGCTSNLELRLAQHQAGTYRGYTHHRRPITLAWAQHFSRIRDAIDAERRIKGWRRAKKEALSAGDYVRLHILSSRGAHNT